MKTTKTIEDSYEDEVRMLVKLTKLARACAETNALGLKDRQERLNAVIERINELERGDATSRVLTAPQRAEALLRTIDKWKK